MAVDDIWPVVVLGAGAAGLMAALRSAECGNPTLLLEKNKRPGIKILMSGGTRCNITHATDNRGIVEAYGSAGKFLHSALASFSVENTLEFFHAEGVATKVEDTGKVFPVSNRASDVLDALLKRLHRSGARLSLDEPATGLVRENGQFRIITPRRTVLAAKVVLTTGGLSYSSSGTTGDGFHFARALGHTIVPTRPALVPVRVNSPWVRDLRGITLPDVAISIWEGSARLVGRRGSLLFAHFGLSGPVVLDVSRVVTGHPQANALTLAIDFLPEISEGDLDQHFREKSLAEGKKFLANLIPPALPRRLAEILLVQAGLPEDRKAAGLSKNDRGKLIRTLKQCRLSIEGTLGYAKAEVTAGGVSLAEVDSRTMQSKIVPGLYLAGEVLDLDGPIGGYNFQAAWSTGWLAGSALSREG